MILATLSLVGGFALLIFSAGLLLRGSTSIARIFKIPEYAIGATIVAFGTSAPELATSLYAAYLGKADLAVANVIGSNFFNIALIIGLAAIIYPIQLDRHIFEKDGTSFVFSGIALLIVASNLLISRIEGLILVSLLIANTIWLLHQKEDIREKEVDFKESAALSALLIVAGLVGIVFGSRLAVTGAIDIAVIYKIPQWIIGATIVAAGTSLPELVTSVVAALKKKPEIAIGNVIGSNIFNVYSVLGFSAMAGNLTVSKAALRFDIPLNLLLSIGLLFMIYDKKISRENGFTLLLFYALLVTAILQVH